MAYLNAAAILPEKLISEIQQYVQGETIYIPKPVSAHQKWGARSGARKLIDDRNALMKKAFKNGRTIDQLADDHHLSVETVKKIVYSK
ncbi:CD3324 family protein [Bacillus sonorensis]|uniref:Protein YraL n=2 Tax=Bacillus sonorensis TaxID=119858 RepID=M5P3X8_9BACI|nr:MULTISPECIES: CD3324 family protein [Bacillus]TWK75964.1 hypothetical protein CHCC20335_2581 [Bacillus paralicheniformis]ASB90890.1 uncharacterized protein S101395_04395 [Bacillus sonorensis]EME74139.1 protein YraL [Bacillus sonorensis L12]MBG9913573.1 hypothetical protein [Bacillus sonorensis]MCF7619698.1 hypothetical protein [Bacillus sonorensis]